MRPPLRTLLLLACAAALVPAALRPGRGRAEAADDATTAAANKAAEADVRALLDRQVADWNRKDLEGFLQGYWNDPKVVFQSGATRSDGFEAMRARYKARYQAEGKEMGTLVFSGVEVLPLAADSTLVRGRWQLTMSDGQKPAGLYTLLLRKFPEGWRIVHDHTSS